MKVRKYYIGRPIENADESLIDYFLENYSLIDVDHKPEEDSFLRYLEKTKINNKNDVTKFG